MRYPPPGNSLRVTMSAGILDRDEERPETGLVPIGICADDYALTPGVSRGIRELLAAGRISATSVMAASEHWPVEAPALRALAVPADIGLHITLTDQRPLAAMPAFAPHGILPDLPSVMSAAFTRRLPLSEIEAEIGRQLAAFIEHFGRPPDHLDGHHHIHQLPGIRDIVVHIAKRLRSNGTYVRTCTASVASIRARSVAVPKALLISTLGFGLARRLARAGLPTNQGFSGVYDFGRESRPMPDIFERFVAGAGARHLVMCHPGHVDAELAGKDHVTAPREAELRFLLGDAWPGLLARERLQIVPLRVAPRQSLG